MLPLIWKTLDLGIEYPAYYLIEFQFYMKIAMRTYSYLLLFNSNVFTHFLGEIILPAIITIAKAANPCSSFPSTI